MFSKLTEKQRLILDCQEHKIVVKACPGSGKTYSVAARIARLLKTESFKHSGIAAISFTKVACDKIREDLSQEYGISNVSYPHFIGTIDSFINQHIFLPFGHLIMGCASRPEIVGTEYNPWYEYDNSQTQYFSKNGKRIVRDRDPNYYFDKVSFDSNNQMLPLMPPSSFHFSWDLKKATNKDGTINKKIQNFINAIFDAKWRHFREGKANQADANYFSLRLLQDFHLILSALAIRYSHLIIDEAQDTTEIQMKIIDCLSSAGLKNVMFIGDPEQSIFEWNTADSELFVSKYNDSGFHNIDLNENRRSSDNICKLLNTMIDSDMASIADVKDDGNIPQVVGYELEGNVDSIKQDFIEKCNSLEIPLEKAAIVFRGKSFGEKYFQLPDEGSYENLPWVNKHYYVRDIVQGKFLSEKGGFKEALKLFERGYHRLKNQNLSFVSKSYLSKQIKFSGYREYRKELFEFIDLLPEIGEEKLKDWILESNNILQENGFPKLVVNKVKADIVIKNLFHKVELSDLPFNLGTIHSVKGQTFDALLLFLKKDSATKNYSNILFPKNKEKDDSKRKKDREEIRLVYVACSRPKRLLWIAVPTEDKVIWDKYFKLA